MSSGDLENGDFIFSSDSFKSNSNSPCTQHGGEIIQYFCPKHDAEGCSSCMEVDHSFCKRRDIRHGLEKELKSLRTRFALMEKQKQANIERLRQDKTILLQQIQSVRSDLNTQLDSMEQALLDEADMMFRQKIKALDEDIVEIQSMLKQLEQTMEQVKSEKKNDFFVGNRTIRKEIYAKIKEQEDATPERSLELHIDEYVKLITEEKKMFATLKEMYTLQKIPDVYNQHRSIKTKDDKNICVIRSMCSLEDGSIVMADLSNKKLKKFDTISKNVSTLIDLPDNPVGLCLAGSKHLAVSLINMKKVQFVSLGHKVTLYHSFPVGDRCRGLACCDGLVYICCGGNPDSKRKEGRGRVEVYTFEGVLILCIYEKIGWPKYISVTNVGHATRIYISDELEGVQMRELKGLFKHSLSKCSPGRLPFCLIGSDQICIGEHSFGKLYTQTCTDDRRVLQKVSLKGRPIALHHDEISSRLFVAVDSCNFIKVFDLQSVEDTAYGEVGGII